ncbi:sensor histidine kinase [Halalkalibacter urbisdiaboli]|uniref:ATP-binding protein n=1 Tax=Halalkalibacter urbisdiaboli TaxID=1960589 RepID=UPI000B4308A0|nr:sensor histidine kinase [Halalkalibacter urbisdiaboli]
MFTFDNYLFALLLVLVPLFIYYSYFYKKDTYRQQPWYFGLFCCVTIVISMSYPLELSSGHIYDLRTIPWLLAFLYAGLRMGIVATLLILVYRFFIGFDDGFFITLFAYVSSGFCIYLYLNKYRETSFKQRLYTSLTLTFINVLFVIIGILYFLENFNQTLLPSFFAYFIISHLVTIAIVVYIIETLQEKEKNSLKLQQAEKLKIVGEMAASVAHEIRNPLTVVKGFIQIFKSDQNLTTKQVSSIELIQSELLRAEKIINDYLSLAKSETTDLELVDLKDSIINVVQIMDSYALLHGTTIKNNIDTSFFISANRNELSQVFINLIKNGIEAIEEKNGVITIDAQQIRNHVEVKISDNGKGMSEEDMHRLGSPFYTTKHQGTGLGTMVCFKIIENLNGKIEVRSKVQEGTTFLISLPLKE